MRSLYDFFSGAAMLGAGTCGLLFFFSWKKTREPLLLIFSLAFFTLAVERCVLLAVGSPVMEEHAMIYLIRLCAYLMILGGIWAKNRNHARGN